MNKNFTETLRINTLNSIPPYDAYMYRSPYLSVGHQNGRYGILRDDGTKFLSFAYDNITLCGFGLLLLTQNGKTGLLHIEQNRTDFSFRIVKQIPCAYDVIEIKSENIIFLKKYGLPTAFYLGQAVQVYLKTPCVLTEDFADAAILSKEQGCSFVCLTKDNTELIVNAETGKTVVETSYTLTLGAYNTARGVVVQQYATGQSQLLYIADEQVKTFSFDGMSVSSIAGLCGNGEAYAVGFAVESDSGILLLDSTLSPISAESFSEITVQPTIAAVSCTGQSKTFQMQKQKLEYLDDEDIFLDGEDIF